MNIETVELAAPITQAAKWDDTGHVVKFSRGNAVNVSVRTYCETQLRRRTGPKSVSEVTTLFDNIVSKSQSVKTLKGFDDDVEDKRQKEGPQ